VANGEVKVERVVIACDCGVVVNPRGVETQLEGGMIYRLSAALFGEIAVLLLCRAAMRAALWRGAKLDRIQRSLRRD
jgi:hypothetical protein